MASRWRLHDEVEPGRGRQGVGTLRGIARGVARTAAATTSTAAIYALWIAGDALTWRRPLARKRWRHTAFRMWARSVARAAGMRVHVTGMPPEPPFLLVSNHLSYMDIVALSSVVDCTFVAKSDVANWPGIGRLCRSMKIIFVDREYRRDVCRVGRLMTGALDEGEGIILFPESTSTAGAEVAPFKSSLLAPAAEQRIPVHFASVRYQTSAESPPAHLAVCWWGDMTFGKHFFELMQLGQFDAELVFGAGPITDSDRKSLAAKLHGAVSESFIPVTTLEGECLKSTGWSRTT